MKSILRTFLLAPCLIVCIWASVTAQQRNITGTVTDEANQPLTGVTVRVDGTALGAVTDGAGKFSLAVPSTDTMLIFSYVGYGERQVTLSAHSGALHITMKAGTGSLNEVVVVGYGTQKKITVTGAISSVSGKELQRIPVSNVSNMLLGSTSGISGVQASGEPGRNAASIFIRGVSTYGSQNPLVVIDGVQQPAQNPFDQLNNLDANDIASITVLKDASATAVYGIRGANGVIVVTTKRGDVGAPKLSLSVNYGYTHAAELLKTVNAYEYGLMRNEAIHTQVAAYGDNSYTPYLFNQDDLWKFQHDRDYTPDEVAGMTGLTDAQKASLNSSPAIYYGSEDWMRQQFGGTGPQKQLNLNVSGGTERVKYFSSLGYFSQGSILDNTSYHGSSTGSSFNRYNFRSNFDINVIKNLSIAVNLSGQFGTTSGPGANNAGPYDLTGRYKAIMQYIFDANPFYSPGLLDGHLINYFEGAPGSAANPLGLKAGSSIGNQNAVYNLLVSGNETLHNTLVNSSITLTYDLGDLTRGLTAHASTNYEGEYTKAVSYFPSLPVYSVRRDPVDPNKLDFFNGAEGANTFNSNPGHNSVWHKIYYEAGLHYNRSFGGHTVGGLVLGNAQKYTMPGDSYNTPSGLMGFVGRATYNYREKYLAEFNMGYNGTEQFREGKRFGFFPAYSLGWVASNESFFPKIAAITYLKIRGSYGEVGNDQLLVGGVTRRYLYLPSTFNTGQGGYYFGNSDGSVVNPYYSGTTEGTIGNPDVTWERARKTDIGLEARFLGDRLSLTADLFQEKRNNILTTIQTIPALYGVPSSSVPPANVGRTTNKGYELALVWKDQVGGFGYTVGANVNYAKNKILYMAENKNPYYWMNHTGFSIGQYFGLVSDGFFDNGKELNNRPYNTFTNNIATLGDIRYKDINGDGLIDNKDIVPIGYPNLPEYYFNLKLGLSYKHFELNAMFTGSARGSFYLNSGMTIPFYKNAGNAFMWEYNGRWTPEKAAAGIKATYPRSIIGASPSSNNYLTSDFWLISNNFKRLSNLEISYTLPETGLLRQAKISAVRIYANGNNLFTWGNQMKGIDPQTQDVGSTYIYPMTRTINFGANIQF